MLARMQRDRMERLQAVMREQGFDALVLLGNTNVVYATGAIWPLADSGRGNFEQPVAVVLADDEWPHLFTPIRADAPAGYGTSAPTTSTARSTSTSTKAWRCSPQTWPGLVPSGGAVAMDEWTNALRREPSCSVSTRRPTPAG